MRQIFVAVIVAVTLAACEEPCRDKATLLGYSERRSDSWTGCDARSTMVATETADGSHVLVECRCPVEGWRAPTMPVQPLP